ncbi:MAG: hypothetical protein LAP85_25265 [Acidobacteriia bacterium]|nr:hypothetical protein [Terriglobia bacterium]
MAVPAFMNSSFRYLETAAVANVATCITDFRTEVVTNGVPAWTEPVANNFKSPPDAQGRFFTVILSTISATRLGIKIVDMFGVTISDRAIDVDVGGTSVQYFTGQFHAFINSARATPECGGGALIDLSPETLTLPNYSTVGCGHRDTTGTVGNQNWYIWYMMSNATATATGRASGSNLPVANTRATKTVSGAYVYDPIMIETSIFGAGNNRWIGRIFQCLRCDDGLAFGAEIQVPIDVGTVGTFKVVGRVAYNGSKMCIRKG